MKRVFSLLVIICFCLLFTSCKKEDTSSNNNDYFISAKFNGEEKIFRAFPIAIMVKLDSIYTLELDAHFAQGSEERFLLIIGRVNDPITTGTYNDEGPLNETQIIGSTYAPSTTDESKIYTAGLQVDNNPRLTINIATLGDKIVSGTFSGTYYNNGGEGPETMAVTEGKFNLPLTQ